MNEYQELEIGRVRGRKLSRFRVWALFAIPLAAILFQVYVPLFFQFLTNLDLPLLATVYFSVMRRSALAGIFTGASIGLVQDSLSHQPLGMFGMVKTLVGYLAASVSVRFDVERAPIRFVLCFGFYLLHQALFWAVRRGLLGEAAAASPQQWVLLALLNACVGVPLFYLFDKLRKEED
jgi:rod shape-determining protein MreD